MAIGTLRRSRKTKLLEKETAKKKQYLKHYKKAGPKRAMTYVEWMKKGEKPTYFKGAGLRRGSIPAQLREAGVSPARFKRKKR